MTYNVSTDVASGSVDAEKLREEIAASGAVTGFGGLTISGDTILVSGMVANQTLLDQVVHDHVAVTLAEYKVAKNAAIDERTQDLIRQGFSFDGHVFSLSVNAQMNWSGLKTFEDILTWPVAITANGDTEYSLAQANLIPFVGTGLSTVSAHYTSGRALKLQVNACATKAEVDAVVDSR